MDEQRVSPARLRVGAPPPEVVAHHAGRWLGIVAGVLLAAFWPRQYLSEAQIGIAAPKLTPELLRNVSSLDREERQRAISQQLVSRQVLERVVREEKLNPSKPVEDVAGWLRTQILVNVDQPIGRGGDNRNGLDSFKLGYIDSSPDRAQSITNRLAYVFVEENSKTQTERAENTSEVLGQQLQASQERLAALEVQLRAKKEANMGRLPDQVGANLAMANGLRQSVRLVLDAAPQRTGSPLAARVADRRHAQRVRHGADPVLDGPAPSRPRRRASRSCRMQLTQEKALGKTDKHPDIIALQGELTNARAELAAIKQPAAAEREELLQGDPIYRQRIQERDAARLRVKTLRAQSAQASAQIGAYQSRVEAAPMVEQDLVVGLARRRAREGALHRSEDEARERPAGRGPRAQPGRRALQRALSRLPRTRRPIPASRPSCC